MSLRKFFRKKADSTDGREAATTKNTNVIVDEAPDIPLGLDVWVEGVDPVVEYISRDEFYLFIANFSSWDIVSSQYTALMVTEKRPGRRRIK
jgi:hypothetical protein